MGATWTWDEQAKSAAAGEREATLRARLVALLLLNLADGLFTLVFLQFHLGEEVNPLMRAAYAGSPALFLALKLCLVQGGVLILWVNRASAAARVALTGGLGLYTGIVAYHCTFAVWLLVAAVS